jgi:hypothetical protein
MRPLFSDAPVMQAAPTMPAQPVGSQLAAAMSGQMHPLNLQSMQMPQIPLASLMAMRAANQTPSAGAMNGAPQQGNMIQGATPQWSAGAPQTAQPNWLQQVMPQMPGSLGTTNTNAAPPAPGLAPGMPSAGAPGQAGILGQMYQGMAPGAAAGGATGFGGG